jgi:V/A-type H+-transporting ATPase subunit D
MARLNVNSTRIERTRQKEREVIARRGHRLLKDKSDKMMRHFIQVSKQNRLLRHQVEEELMRILRLFMTARIQMTSTEIENAVSGGTELYQIVSETEKIMGLAVPKISLRLNSDLKPPHAECLTTSASFDRAVHSLSALLAKIAELANVEKACEMLAAEIIKIRRRVNALEYAVIPQISETIKYIGMKLTENERGNLVRLMKVKEIYAKQEDSE